MGLVQVLMAMGLSTGLMWLVMGTEIRARHETAVTTVDTEAASLFGNVRVALEAPPTCTCNLKGKRFKIEAKNAAGDDPLAKVRIPIELAIYSEDCQKPVRAIAAVANASNASNAAGIHVTSLELGHLTQIDPEEFYGWIEMDVDRHTPGGHTGGSLAHERFLVHLRTNPDPASAERVIDTCNEMDPGERLVGVETIYKGNDYEALALPVSKYPDAKYVTISMTQANCVAESCEGKEQKGLAGADDEIPPGAETKIGDSIQGIVQPATISEPVARNPRADRIANAVMRFDPAFDTLSGTFMSVGGSEGVFPVLYRFNQKVTDFLAPINPVPGDFNAVWNRERGKPEMYTGIPNTMFFARLRRPPKGGKDLILRYLPYGRWVQLYTLRFYK